MFEQELDGKESLVGFGFQNVGSCFFRPRMHCSCRVASNNNLMCLDVFIMLEGGQMVQEMATVTEMQTLFAFGIGVGNDCCLTSNKILQSILSLQHRFVH